MSTTNPNFKNRRTPGVYISEIDSFPTSIVGVDTAVPGFVGYTQQAIVSGKSVLMEPVAISSMADFEQIFGTEYNTVFNINPLLTSPPSQVNPDFTVNGQGYILDVAGQPQFNLYYSMRLFYANGGSTCYVVSVGNYSSAVTAQPLLDGLKAMSYQVGPTILVAPDAVLVPTIDDFKTITQTMLTQCETTQDRVAIFDVYNATEVTQSNVDLTLDPVITAFTSCIPTQPVAPNYGMAYFPFLNTSIVQSADINYTNFNPEQTPSGTTDADPTNPVVSPPITPTQLQYILTLFNQQQYPNTVQNGQTVNNPTQEKVQYYIDTINQDYSDPDNGHGSSTVQTLNNTLTSALPAYANLLSLVALKEGLLPPSGAMAGLFTLNDRTRGVWNAPANLPVASTISLTVNLNDAQQGDLNVPIDGKAIDVIRYFPGQGPVVWGARTLDGNSQDWRYIQVRRTIVYIETSIKNAMNQFVFAANDASTWVAVTQMISGFLQGLWSQGGLMGDKASDAFTVLCGVPQTMTSTDILNGYMVVQVTVQMIHPAEFIELTFKQTMQGS